MKSPMKLHCQGLPSGHAALLFSLLLLGACGESTPLPGNGGSTLSDAGAHDADTGPVIDACVAQPLTSENRDVDLFFAVATSDSTATIDDDASRLSRWETASGAMRTFVTGLAGNHFGAGMLFFPRMIAGDDGGGLVEACSGSDYLAPAVSVAPLEADGAQAMAIEAALGSRSLDGGNAMAAALAGALQQAVSAKGRSGHIVHTILVTDGTLDPCGAGVNGAAAVAGEAFRTNHLETYVLGVGPDASSLDPIAAAGGAFHAYTATGSESAAAALTTMGTAMRRCHFYFPLLPLRDFNRINMVMNYDANDKEYLPLLTDGSGCGTNPGWFYDSPTSPAYATLCPATCNALLERPDREVTALLGCFTSSPLSKAR